jgi:hypothetical protein
MWSVGANGVAGFEWFLVILAFVVDLGAYAGRNQARRSG